ncbi:MAG: hypothetical protein EXX96DRAFT_577553 [Benjaminiella poitrasii]|nr:MAG: hypothetical protein EXX96DRAFT_577553 [Benjaminiella poitrasii]
MAFYKDYKCFMLFDKKNMSGLVSTCLVYCKLISILETSNIDLQIRLISDSYSFNNFMLVRIQAFQLIFQLPFLVISNFVNPNITQ